MWIKVGRLHWCELLSNLQFGKPYPLMNIDRNDEIAAAANNVPITQYNSINDNDDQLDLILIIALLKDLES